MVDPDKHIQPINIEDEMRQSYLDYAMSVIVGRALPDVRDGLKPVHRRALYAMHELSNSWNKPYKKSARIVGDVIGRFHPHGDSAVYDTIVRMAQSFSLRYMLVDGQGNFGSVDGDAAAAMRYTEIRMARIAHEMITDIEKDTVDFAPNYDGSEHEPVVFPARIPNLLVNGSSGIAVGMATNIPPHNLGEVVNACLALIDTPDLSIEELMQHIPGPDFPTAAMINGSAGIVEAYKTGRGRIYLRADTSIETSDTGRQYIIVNELPYQVNKARLVEKIAELVKDKKIEGISELRDESDKDGMRMVIAIRRGDVPEVVLNNLLQQTSMQTVFGINMVVLEDGQPRLLNLKQILDAFIRHRREVVTRRSLFLLDKARNRAHLLAGLAVALGNVDAIVGLIKQAPTPSAARAALLSQVWSPDLVKTFLPADESDSRPRDLDTAFGLHGDGYHLSDAQAKAILELRLHRLTGLEKDKILAEYKELLGEIADLLQILKDPDRLMQVIKDELNAVKDQYQDKRLTRILQQRLNLSMEDLITEEDWVVTLSRAGYAKAQSLDNYQAQKRGGKGKSATQIKAADVIDKLFVANTHDTILCFSSAGKVYWLKVYELPQAGRNAQGKPMVNLLPLEEGEQINAVLPVREYSDDQFIFMATEGGTVKKTPLSAFSRPRSNGIIALNLQEDDKLINVAITDGDYSILLFSSAGKAMRFHESKVRSLGRTAQGVRGIRLGDKQKVLALIAVKGDEGHILTATSNGYGKRTPIADYPLKTNRGGMGVIAIKTSERNGDLVSATQVTDEDDVMLISDRGTLVRTPVGGVSSVGRNAQGVTLINLSKGEQLVGIERIVELQGDDDDEENAETDVEIETEQGLSTDD